MEIRNYYCDENIRTYPVDKWQILLDFTLPRANYAEFNLLFITEKIPTLLSAAQVEIPYDIRRVYRATHRFLLTSEVVGFLKNKSYNDFCNSVFEDPALFYNNTLLLGSISHEGYAVLLLNRAEREKLNSQGFDFWCEWSLK